MMKDSIIFILLLLVLFSCKQETTTRNFPETKDLKSSELYLNEVIKFDKIYKTKDYAIIKDGFRNATVFYFVYKLSDFSFLYSFAQKGEGPEEFLMPTVIKNMPENYFSFRDHGKDKLATYLLTDTAAVLQNIRDIKPQEDCFYWEINYLNDSLFLLKNQNDTWSRRELWDLHAKKIIDSIPNTFDIKKKLGKKYYSSYEDFWIISNKERLAFGYYFMDLLEVGSIKDNRIWIDKHIGIDKIPEFHLYGPGKRGGKYEHNFLNNVVYYKYLTCDNENVYALYANVPFGEIGVAKISTIEVYSWNGEPKTLLKLDKSISDFVVDESTGAIYGFDTNHNNEDFILKYQLN